MAYVQFSDVFVPVFDNFVTFLWKLLPQLREFDVTQIHDSHADCIEDRHHHSPTSVELPGVNLFLNRRLIVSITV